jgi:hypothetical protein
MWGQVIVSWLNKNPQPSLTPVQVDHTVDIHTKHASSDREQNKSNTPSRRDLESAYAKVTRIPDRDERKARARSMIRRAYHAVYQKGRGGSDLEKSQEEALQCTGLFHPHLAEHSHHLGVALMVRFQQSGDIADIERAISLLQNAVSLTEDSDAEKSDRLESLGSLTSHVNSVTSGKHSYPVLGA